MPQNEEFIIETVADDESIDLWCHAPFSVSELITQSTNNQSRTCDFFLRQLRESHDSSAQNNSRHTSTLVNTAPADRKLLTD